MNDKMSREDRNAGQAGQDGKRARRRVPDLRKTVIFAFLGALMFLSKLLLEALPNVHLIGVMIVAVTAVYRWEALWPIYVFVFLCGLFEGINLWWVPYLYVWTVLWGAVMLLPKKLPPKLMPIVYAAVCSLHGFLFGVLYAPFQAIVFGLNFEGTVAWVAAGFPFDCIHGVSNLCLSVLILPLIKAIRLAERAAAHGLPRKGQ